VVKKLSKFRPKSQLKPKAMFAWVGIFAVVGVGTLLLTRAATPGIAVTVDTTLPEVGNYGAYGDDRLATVWWSAPSNASAKGIVGYYVTYGDASNGGIYTNAKQTTNRIVQLQPLENGKSYNVKIQAVHGSTVKVPTPGSWGGGTADEARASGRVSKGVTLTVTPSGTRVNNLRSEMTGFFDDFNTPAGGFDELKWNQATSACVEPGQTGAFINNQYHSHNQIRSILGNDSTTYCDRAQMVSRPRATFDITGKTEANPGKIVGDFDGAAIRDTWYIDLVPVDVRTNKIPLDITSHADVAHDGQADPAMIRIAQSNSNISIFYTDYATKQNLRAKDTYTACPDFKGDMDFSYYGGGDGGWCGGPVRSGSNMPVMGTGPWTRYFPSPNVRMQYRVEISPTKIKVFLNDVRMLEADTPPGYANVKQYTVNSTLFSYNTGKDSALKPTTSLLHWDNFGFNGPAPTTVVHNYQDGLADGLTPVLGTGTAVNKYISGGATRTAKIQIPDPIKTPKEARLMFTTSCFGYQDYNWKSTDSFTVNGTKYSIPSPATIQLPPVLNTVTAGHYEPYAIGVPVNSASLVQGMNEIKFSMGTACDLLNVHIELEYTKGTEPAYTQPKDIFGAAKYLATIQPAIAPHDAYLFQEQEMGLPSGDLTTTTPVDPPPTGGTDTTPPTITMAADGIAITSTDTSVTVRNLNRLVWRPTASDNIGTPTVTYKVNNSTVTLTGGAYTFGAQANGDFQLQVTATDAAGNPATKTLQIRLRSPDINRNGKVDIGDIGAITKNWSSADAAVAGSDLSLNGKVDIADIGLVTKSWNQTF
jgi:hypothetical protein